uniref:Uncharacterized protein n=1 Tax=Anopheles coluzzii TaxID=1518534 RepID=A0A8W7PIJ1_ANOCL
MSAIHPLTASPLNVLQSRRLPGFESDLTVAAAASFSPSPALSLREKWLRRDRLSPLLPAARALPLPLVCSSFGLKPAAAEEPASTMNTSSSISRLLPTPPPISSPPTVAPIVFSPTPLSTNGVPVMSGCWPGIAPTGEESVFGRSKLEHMSTEARNSLLLK